MTESAALELRRTRLAETVALRPAPLADGEEGVFVALDDSPPVRTVLTVVEGDRRRALEVAWVVEVADRDEVKGFYGRWVGDEALERAMRVGTEHLEDGTPVVQPVVHDHSASLDMSDMAMAMPAPVIVSDDDTGVIDTGDGDGEDEREREADTADHAETVASPDNVHGTETVSDPEPTSDGEVETMLDGEGHVAAAAAASDERADASDAPSASGDAGQAESGEEAPSESGDAGQAESSESSADPGASAKSGRKKRGRKRR